MIQCPYCVRVPETDVSRFRVAKCRYFPSTPVLMRLMAETLAASTIWGVQILNACEVNVLSHWSRYLCHSAQSALKMLLVPKEAPSIVCMFPAYVCRHCPYGWALQVGDSVGISAPHCTLPRATIAYRLRNKVLIKASRELVLGRPCTTRCGSVGWWTVKISDVVS